LLLLSRPPTMVQPLSTTTTATTTKFLSFLLLVATCSAFSPTPSLIAFIAPSTTTTTTTSSSSTSTTTTTTTSSTCLYSTPRKRRRRRKKPLPNQDGGEDELPDFDLFEDDEEESTKNAIKKGMDPELARKGITPAQMAINSNTQLLLEEEEEEETTNFMLPDEVANLENIVLDEKLEKLIMSQTLLDPTTSTTNVQGGGGGGKKKARQQARKAAAIERNRLEEEANAPGLLSFLEDENGDITGLKVVESGTWAAIGILVAWEIYINSPLFDRAAPIAPFVYNFLP